MEKINYKKINIIKTFTVILLYFFWPTLSSFILNSFNVVMNHKTIFTLCFNLILFVIIVLMYHKELIKSLKELKDNYKKSIKNILYLLISIVITQILTNSISLLVLGVDNKIMNTSALFNYLNTLPLLMGMMMVIYYPIVETVIFSKILKSIINNKWLFIILSSLFFWLANIVSFGISFDAMIMTLSCLTSTIVINNFYYKNDNIAIIFIVKMIYNLIFILLP